MPFGLLAPVCHIQCGTQASRNRARLAVTPEMHEKKARRFFEHVTVEGCHFDIVGSKRADHPVDLAAQENEIARGHRMPRAGGLKIDCGSHSHRRRDYLAGHANDLRPGNRLLVDDAIELAGLSKYPRDRSRVELDCG